MRATLGLLFVLFCGFVWGAKIIRWAVMSIQSLMERFGG